MKKYLNFDLAIKDGTGRLSFVIPCSVDIEDKDHPRLDELTRRFAEMKVFEQGLEVYGMKHWMQNLGVSEEKGEYHFEGYGYAEVD